MDDDDVVLRRTTTFPVAGNDDDDTWGANGYVVEILPQPHRALVSWQLPFHEVSCVVFVSFH